MRIACTSFHDQIVHLAGALNSHFHELHIDIPNLRAPAKSNIKRSALLSAIGTNLTLGEHQIRFHEVRGAMCNRVHCMYPRSTRLCPSGDHMCGEERVRCAYVKPPEDVGACGDT